jgi:hypothetical protein
MAPNTFKNKGKNSDESCKKLLNHFGPSVYINCPSRFKLFGKLASLAALTTPPSLADFSCPLLLQLPVASLTRINLAVTSVWKLASNGHAARASGGGVLYFEAWNDSAPHCQAKCKRVALWSLSCLLGPTCFSDLFLNYLAPTRLHFYTVRLKSMKLLRPLRNWD